MPFLKRSFITYVLLISTPLWAADPEPAQDTLANTASQNLPDPVATVNEAPISRAMVETLLEIRQSQAGGNQQINLNDLVDELVNQELLIQDAEQKKLVENDPQLAMQLELTRRSQITTAVVGQILDAAENDETALKKEYERLLPSLTKQQYKTRQILVDNEDKAKALITTLEEGSDFSQVAKTQSSDNSAERGGDIGWLAIDSMPEAYGEAVSNLDKGAFTKEPVKTRFGWHVIQLDDIRTSEAPPFEELRPQLANQLRGRALKEHLDALREAAQIEIQPRE